MQRLIQTWRMNYFWNQLYRLSLNQEACKELQDFLPKEINEILCTLQKPAFNEYFKNSGNEDRRFFQDLRPLSSKVYTQILNIANDVAEDGQALIVAPKDLWPRIAQILPLQFPTEEDWRKRSIPTHSGWLYPLTFDAEKGLKEA